MAITMLTMVRLKTESAMALWGRDAVGVVPAEERH
jgi:hypothetical protein